MESLFTTVLAGCLAVVIVISIIAIISPYIQISGLLATVSGIAAFCIPFIQDIWQKFLGSVGTGNKEKADRMQEEIIELKHQVKELFNHLEMLKDDLVTVDHKRELLTLQVGQSELGEIQEAWRKTEAKYEAITETIQKHSTQIDTLTALLPTRCD